MRIIIILLFLSGTMIAKSASIENQVAEIVRYQEQKKIYENQQSEGRSPSALYTPLGQLPTQEGNSSQRCINTTSIIIEKSVLLDKKKQQQIIAPYLNRCNSIVDFSNIVTKLNNEYISKGYVTSRAYLKPQDIATGHLLISTMEGKIEQVKGEHVHTGLVFSSSAEKYLNLRDLEVGIEQLNRLRSLKTTMEINPGKKEGYSSILMKGERVGSVIHGSLGTNNYGTVKSGKYQLNGSLSWENPLGINDIVTVSYNTTSKQDQENQSAGDSISYGLPIGRAYLEVSYGRFKYDQVVNGLNMDYRSKGESKTAEAKLEYKLFHTQTQKGKIDLSLKVKKNDNYLAGEYLDTSSSKLTIAKLGYTQHFSGSSWDGYGTLTFHKGLDWFNAKAGSFSSPKFKKLTLDLSYNKRFKMVSKTVSASYNFSFHGQYAGDGIVASEFIGVGGSYSVRGFKNEGQLSGNKGFYIRNEFSYSTQLLGGLWSPYLGFDLGHVVRDERSSGGHLVGGAVGLRINWKGFSIDAFRTFPLLDSNRVTYADNGDEIIHDNQGFSGFTLSYNF